MLLDIFTRLKSRKTQTIFTGFGIMWAMLILVILEGAGAALYNGMVQQLGYFDSCKVFICGGHTLTRKIDLTEDLAEGLAKYLHAFEAIMPVFEKKCFIGYQQDTYKTNLLGVHAGYEALNRLKVIEGRFLRERDLAEKLPVCILGLKKKKQIFGNDPAVGSFVAIEGTVLSVIGVLDETTLWNNDQVIVPSSLFKGLFPESYQRIDHITATLLPKQDFGKVETKIRAYFAKQLAFDVEDQDALYISSSSKRAKDFALLFMVIRGFIWLVICCFLISGVFGVSNMMLIVLKERTQELAIRKVVGAESTDIIGFMLLESIVINLLSGILGLGIGLTLMKCINRYLVPIIQKYGISHFELQFSVVLSALALLVLSGCLAGMIPARRAWSIKPVDALNNE